MEFDKKKWGNHAIYSQGACNPLGVIISMTECLRDWRKSPEWKGTDSDKDCIPARLMMFQVNFLMGFNGGIATQHNYPDGDKGWDRDFNLMHEWVGTI